MVKLHFETLAPGMKAKLDAPHRTRPGTLSVIDTSRVVRKVRHGSINCVLADAVKMPFNRTQA
jgi:hypothetical protein